MSDYVSCECDNDNKKYSFKLLPKKVDDDEKKNNRVISFTADTTDERDSWIQAISTAISVT